MRDLVTLARTTVITLFAENASHPSALLDDGLAIARSAGQGRPQAGACALPLTEASTVAGWCRIGGGSWRAIVQSIVTIALLAVASPVPAFAQTTTSAQPSANDARAAYIAEASKRFGIPEHWIVAVMRAESAGDPLAVSSAGAIGLMQIMPDTWDELRARHALGDDPFDARDNIMAGTAYLRQMWDRYGNVGAMLAAYNAGPGRYDEYLSASRHLPAETRAYVATFAPILSGDPALNGAVSATVAPPDWRDSPLFVARFGDLSDAPSLHSGSAFDGNPPMPTPRDETTDPAQNNSMFVPLFGEGARP